MSEKPVIEKWPDGYVSGSKRTHITESEWLDDWFCGWGKDESCQFEGTWWDMICFARNILASENTRISAPEFYHPEMKIQHYLGDEPYQYKAKK